ncbi:MULTISPECIES: ABC transporter permease [Micromonospora]|uniref:ABC transporter permease n=1 Tax=Micromonospora solifontis TaxID=2487138 RepID=A0ABX9WJG4_9ACTN|nr:MULTISPECIES: ABC transporter permease [Micromonospora]NES15244.1 ABC transporter permease [Micromonospora sp. PPF5-17B]NES36516.1 ABC transporter permease [Micromonospora solifontis]NES56340.1 ABC transporter permease [Micromonospora sp. PPF5-6]RNL99406.1 ABC transporter permease [Micromonospora solifontis]
MTALAHVPTSAGEPAAAPRRSRSRLLPYLLLLPGAAWLLIFFALPLLQLAAASLYDPGGSLSTGYAMTWAFDNYPAALQAYWPHFVRSFAYSAIALVLALLMGYPLAYAIAQKAGRWKNLLLVAVVAPQFTSFLVRTLAWKTILSDNGALVGLLRDVHLLGPDGRLLATPFAVVLGLTYNFLPFLVLPLYASLERLDSRLLEAASDLYASPLRAFQKVTLPLSMPGLIAGTLLFFIPATGDYINAELLGTPNEYMIGNVIDSAFLVRLDYPQGAALSFLLMAAILAIVFGYLRKAGTEEVL